MDYLPTSGTLIFAEGQTSQSLTLTLLDDDEPELDEYIFITLTSVELNESSTDSVDLSGEWLFHESAKREFH